MQDQSDTIRELDLTLDGSVGESGSTMECIAEEEEELEIELISDEQPLLTERKSDDHDKSSDTILVSLRLLVGVRADLGTGLRDCRYRRTVKILGRSSF